MIIIIMEQEDMYIFECDNDSDHNTYFEFKWSSSHATNIPMNKSIYDDYKGRIAERNSC